MESQKCQETGSSMSDILHSSVSSTIKMSWTYMSSIPVLEGTIFVILATITVFRKRLSSNYKYRPGLISKKTSTSQVVGSCKSKQNTAINNSIKPLIDYINDSPSTSFVHAISDVATNLYKLSASHEATAKTISFDSISVDILWHIIEILSYEEIVLLSSTNRYFRTLLNDDKLWERLWKQRYGHLWEHHAISRIKEKRMITWDPFTDTKTPRQGWKMFYRQFEICWIDWLLAGASSGGYCLLSLFGSIIDVTEFLPAHPGSLESLSDYAGGDASEQFLDIGHSTQAYYLASRYVICETNAYSGMTNRALEFEKKVNGYEHSKSMFSRRKISKFESKMKADSKRAAESVVGIDSFSILPSFPPSLQSIIRNPDPDATNVLEPNSLKPMIPSINSQHDCLSSTPIRHVGNYRMFWDPVDEKWFIWWTCCGYGKEVNGFNSFAIH